jgi:LysM repeat protein
LTLTLGPAAALAAPSATSGGSGCGQFYTVRPGDTLYRIAVRFHTTVWKLTQLNALPNPNRIYAGQRLCVKAGGQLPMGFLYTVRQGDTLNSIARRYGWSASYLASVNRLSNPNLIYAGQILLIPYH